MSSRRPSPTPKRPLVLKRADGEPLTRADIQYDVLHAIFSDTTPAFTNPYVGEPHEYTKVSFRELYIQAILNSSKATKSFKEKIMDSPDFARDFAMLALLVNVGRINTSMSFFAETKTPKCTYHPIPSLQRTGGNLQDGARIRHVLKAGLLNNETPLPPHIPDEIFARARAGFIPPTSVLNLLFILSSHSSLVGSHFSQRFDFLDVFLRNEYSSASRAKAFLWTCFNYLENPGSDSDDYDAQEIPNPFAEPNKSTAPVLISLTPEEIAAENVDTEEEKALGSRMVANRDQIVKQNAAKGEKTKANDEEVPVGEPDETATKATKGKKKGSRQPSAVENAETPSRRQKKAPAEKAQSRKSKLKNEAKGANSTPSSSHQDDMSIDDEDLQDPSHTPANGARSGKADGSEASTSGFRILTGLTTESRSSRGRQHRYSPYQSNTPEDHANVPRSLRPPVAKRGMLQYAWDLVNTTDPLVDSDNEPGDDGDHFEYTQRLKVVSHLAQRQWREPSRVLRVSVDPSAHH
ncbi:hypothetical protein CC2G_000936 [Coprinopsis cinerea AmutBmut pab1-1]|nr:hypothetical protein CC2G_000936 [Coprinopsis cinerea AmutBmut pab1-1]